jgi:hypothetical protein
VKIEMNARKRWTVLSAVMMLGLPMSALGQQPAMPPEVSATQSATQPAAPVVVAQSKADPGVVSEGPAPATSVAQAASELSPQAGWYLSTRLGIPIRFYGEFWVDTGYLNRENTQPGLPNQNTEYMTGRFVLGGIYSRTFGNLTALAKLELLALVNDFADGKYGEPHIQDAYVQLGTPLWDVQVGRLLAWEVYYRGQGIELYTAEEAGAAGGPRLYLVDFTRGQTNGPGQAAFHLRPINWLSFELATVYGFETDQNSLGVRPAIDLHLGRLQFVAGAEYLSQKPVKSGDQVETIAKGYGARLQYIFPYVTAGVDFAQARVDVTGINGLVDAAKTLDKTSLGGWVDLAFWRNSFGAGYHRTTQKNAKGEENWQYQAFVSYLYRLPIEGLSVKAVYGWALAHIQDVDANSEFENALKSVRLRILYQFN